MAEKPVWMTDPLVSDIDEAKLEFLGGLLSSGQGKSQKEMMSHVMAIAAQAKSKNITFSSNEVSTVIAAIKKHSTPDELKKIDEIIKKASR